MARQDDYQERRAHLAGMSDEELYQYFWKLADQLVEPMLEAGRIYTTPAVERSILLRMGFSSLEAKPIVDGLMERDLLAHGAGNAVWKLSRKLKLPLRETGIALAGGRHWDELANLFVQGGRLS